MEFSMRSFAVVCLLLLVSLSTDMSGPLAVDAQRCDWTLCQQYCSLQGLPACCSFFSGQCLCTDPCPLLYVKKEITEEVMAGATDKEPFIKKTVIA